MQLNSQKPDLGIRQPSPNLGWSKGSYLNEYQPDFQASTWVHLLELPNPFSHDEALLLCQSSEDEWVAWIPDHGEAVLNVRQFCY